MSDRFRESRYEDQIIKSCLMRFEGRRGEVLNKRRKEINSFSCQSTRVCNNQKSQSSKPHFVIWELKLKFYFSCCCLLHTAYVCLYIALVNISMYSVLGFFKR